MKILMVTLSIIYSLSIQAFTPSPESCEEDSLKSITGFLPFIQNNELQMSFDYSLSPDCTYTVSSEVVIPNSDSLEIFMDRLLNPATNLASADKSKVSDLKVTSQGSEFKQVVTVKKGGIKAEIVSTCKYVLKNSNAISYKCKVNPDSSKTKGIVNIRLFEKNETSISCVAGVPKKCTFKTIGKAKSLLTKSTCDLAAPGATETFESTYRLIHHLTYGNVTNIKKGKEVVDRFYLKAKDHPSIGKAAFSIHDDL